ncbi:DUF3231 family protein [Robertmurraya sp. P23]|uniref:DUF3231 family protein n=1 Tax=Robertmurraya sp. P23 TaxID=3436931 RepID=UPI003D954DDA
MEVYNRRIDILLEKGLYTRPPNISTPHGVDYVKNQNFMKSWLGERRPLNVIEISQIHFNLEKTILAKAVVLAFSQVVKSKKSKKFLSDTVMLANKHIDEFNAKFQEDNLPVPSSWEDQITNSTDSPFSDRLIMFHCGFLYQSALAYYGSGMAVSMRPDLTAQFEKIIMEVLKSAGKWADMIKNGWLEQTPQTDDRGALVHQKELEK